MVRWYSAFYTCLGSTTGTGHLKDFKDSEIPYKKTENFTEVCVMASPSKLGREYFIILQFCL